MDLRHALDALRIQCPVVDAAAYAGTLKRSIRVLLPALTPRLQQRLVVPLAHLLPEPVAGDGAHGEHDVRVVVSVVALASGFVDAQISDHASRHKLGLDKLADQVEPLRRIQFGRQGNVNFACDLGILPLFNGLDCVPQCRAIRGPGRRAGRREDFPMLDAALAAVVVDLARALVHQLQAGAVGAGGNAAAAG